MKKIKDFEDYGITSCGRVYSFKSNKFLKPRKDRNGYLRVILYNNGKRKDFLIHRLVAEAYIPNPEGLSDVDHINGNKEENYINNLQWMTHVDNTRKSRGKKIRCVELDMEFPSQCAAAQYCGCYHQNISRCLKGITKTAGGFHWEVVE